MVMFVVVPPEQISAGVKGCVLMVGSGTTVIMALFEIRLAQFGEVTITIQRK